METNSDATLADRARRSVALYGLPQARFRDDRSRRQIAFFLTHAIDTVERNRCNRQRWNDHLAWQWYEQVMGAPSSGALDGTAAL